MLESNAQGLMLNTEQAREYKESLMNAKIQMAAVIQEQSKARLRNIRNQMRDIVKTVDDGGEALIALGKNTPIS